MRDLAFPILQSIPPLRRQMNATMQGGKMGIFSRP